IAPRLALFKPLATAISIGSGGPFGAEGPIIPTAGAPGPLIGHVQRTTAAGRKVLVAAGAAAGTAATFNAPAGAGFLALEVLLFQCRARPRWPVARASGVAAGLRWLVQGAAALFPVAAIHELTARDLPVFAGLGLVAGLMAVFLSKAVYVVEEAFDRMPLHW